MNLKKNSTTYKTSKCNYRIEKKWYVVNIPHEVHLLDLSCCILVKYGLQVTFYLPKYCKKVPIYCIKIQVKSWFVAINTSTEK